MKTIHSIKPAHRAGIAAISSALLFAGLLLSTGSFSQQAPSASEATASVATQLSDEVPLQQFVGIYQLPNKVAFLQFSIREDALHAKQLWDGREYLLARTGDNRFESKDEGHQVEFLQDAAGQFGQVKILGRIMCSKVSFDPTVVSTLSAAQLKRLEGAYTMQDDAQFKLTISASSTGLLLKQLWDGKEIAFTPRSETFFLNQEGTFPLSFDLRAGQVEQLVCFEKDVWLKAQ